MSYVSRKEMLAVCRLVYDRYLTNAAGSNFCARASATTFFCSAHDNAKRTRLRMDPDDLLLVDVNGNVLDGRGEVTSSWATYSRIMREFPEVDAVIHGHPRLATAFACGDEPMPPLLDALKPHGEVPILDRSLFVDSPEFGEAFLASIAERRDKLPAGVAVLYPYHGLTVASGTLEDAFDLFERIEFNAEAIIYRRLLGNLAELELGGRSMSH